MPVPKVTLEMEIQTEEEDDDSLASSSSTILPPIPTSPVIEVPADSPPAYNQIPQDYRALAAAALKKWHPGVVGTAIPLSSSSSLLPSGSASLFKRRGADGEDEEEVSFEPLPGGVSEELVEEWKALQEELGVGCGVIDKIVENSVRIPRRPQKEGEATMTSNGKRRSASGRFYNIYNKFYIGGSGSESDAPAAPPSAAVATSGGRSSSSLPMWMGASALVLLAISPYMLVLLAPATHYAVPGGPTYYDRTAWSSFNGMQAAGEGFGFGAVAGAGAGGVAGGDGGTAVWNFLGRVGGGAARIARGWPT